MKHKKLKGGYADLCPVCDGLLDKKHDDKNNIDYQKCTKCPYIHLPNNLVPEVKFQSAFWMK